MRKWCGVIVVGEVELLSFVLGMTVCAPIWRLNISHGGTLRIFIGSSRCDCVVYEGTFKGVGLAETSVFRCT